MGFFSSVSRAFFGESNEAKAIRLAAKDPFKIKFAKEFLTLENGEKIEVLSVYIRGIINSGCQDIEKDEVNLGTTLYSFSEDYPEEAPVMCAIESLQSDKYPFLNHVSDPLTAHYGLCGSWDEWVRLLAVPVVSLTFSRNGPLTLKLKLKVNYLITSLVDKVITSIVNDKVATLSYVNTQSGYFDSIEQRKRGKELAVSLAVLVAGIDGSRDEEEAEIVTAFIRKQIASIDDLEEQNVIKKRLNNAVIQAHSVTSFAAIRRRGFELADEAAEFDSDIQFQIMELLLDVAGADSLAAKLETDFLNDLAHRIGLDLEEYKKLRDKALPISIYESKSDGGGNQVESMLGLNSGMSVAEKKSHLSKEFRKWNPLQNSSDQVKSKQAKDMVKAIGELRKNL